MTPNKIFIIPYRNREKEKTLFITHMNYILEDIDKSYYEIFFVHQQDNRPFNRGAMKNIGFLAMRDKYPSNYKDITFIFNDIDTYPRIKNILNYNTTIGTIKHYYGFKFALGGIFSIKGADFEKCGGFPNLWGWGLEDNLIQGYAIKCGLTIDRSNFFDYRDSKNFIQLENFSNRICSKKEPWLVENGNNNETYHDINNLKYLIENNFIQVKNFTTKHDPTDEIYYKHNVLKEGRPLLDNKFNPNPNQKPKDKPKLMNKFIEQYENSFQIPLHNKSRVYYRNNINTRKIIFN
jgi:hypothetical protein